MPNVTSDTFRHPDRTFRYRLLLDGKPILTSGGFLLERDAVACGTHISQDPEVLAYLPKE